MPFIVLILLLLGMQTHALSQAFDNPFRVQVGGEPRFVITPDLNNDGKPDLVIAYGSTTGVVRIDTYLASSSGYTLTAQITPPNGRAHCLAADFNNDALADLACDPDSAIPAKMAVYLGKGDGTFQVPIMTSFPQTGQIADVGDINNDGNLDLFLDPTPSPNGVLLGDGAGHFSYLSVFFQGQSRSTKLVDLNHDGNLDIVGTGSLAAALGDGHGHFTGPYNKPQYGLCTLGDFEGNGGIVAACIGPGSPTTLYFFRSRGDGTFDDSAPLRAIPFASKYVFMAPLQAIDINRDGILDLAIQSLDGLRIATGRPGLEFTVSAPYAAGTTSVRGAGVGTLTDMNGDGHPDFVSVGSGNIYISYGKADGSLDAPTLLEGGDALFSAESADFDGDGAMDAVVLSNTGPSFYRGLGNGRFAKGIAIPAPPSFPNVANLYLPLLIEGDFTGDKKPDFIVVNPPISTISYSNPGGTYLYRGNGDGTFDAARPVPPSTFNGTTSQSGGQLTRLTADFNRDGIDDLIHLQYSYDFPNSGKIFVYLSHGDGTFDVKTTTVPFQLIEPTFTLGDFNGDKLLDIAMATQSTLVIVCGNGDGTFSTTPYAQISQPSLPGLENSVNNTFLIVAGDFDGDNLDDLASVAKYYDGSSVLFTNVVWIYFSNGNGSFSRVLGDIFPDRNFDRIQAAPLTRSGLSDIVLSRYQPPGGDPIETKAATVFTSLPGRQFRMQTFATGVASVSSRPVDFNRDGLADLFITSNFDSVCSYISACTNTFGVLLNHELKVRGELTASPQRSIVGMPYTLTAAFTSNPSTDPPLVGDVTFTVDGVPLPPVPLVSNAASININFNLTIGLHTLRATWPGSADLPPVVMGATHTIIGKPSLITLSSSLNPSRAGTQITLTSSLSPAAATGTITLKEGGKIFATLPATATGAFSTTTLSRGVHSLVASYSGDSTYESSESQPIAQIVQGNPSSAVLQISPDSSYVLQPVLLAARISSSVTGITRTPQGSVSFMEGIAVVSSAIPVDSNGNAQTVISSLPAGSHNLTAVYDGDDFYDPSASVPINLSVQLNPIAISLGATPSPAFSFQPAGISAQLTTSAVLASIAGTPISFFANGSLLGTAPASSSGRAVYTAALPQGNYLLTANISQTPVFTGATSTPLLHVVKRDHTVIILSVSPNPSPQRRNITLQAGVSALSSSTKPDGTISFFDGGTLLRSVPVAGGGSTFDISTFAPGTHAITASYTGSANFEPSTSAAVALVITPRDFTVSAPPSITIRTEYHATLGIDLTSIGGFADTIRLSCLDLPEHASCTFDNDSPLLAADQTLHTHVIIDTDDVLRFKSESKPPLSLRTVAVLALLLPLGLFAMCRRHVLRLACFFFAFLSAIALSGCGNKYPAHTPPGKYQISIQGYSPSDNLTRIAHVNLIVTE